MNTLIELQSLSKSFDRNLLIDNVSFKLNQGEITTLVGQNGAGKTTIAKIILKLESYDKGVLIIQDDLHIGYVPQALDISFSMPMMSRDLLKILAPDYDKDDLDQFKDFINYSKIEYSNILDISGGELQKLIITATLMNKPDIVIFDEPTQFLDVNSQQEFYRLLNQLKTRNNLTIFMISHDLFTVMKNSDQVICLNKHVCCSGKPRDLEKNIKLKNALSEIGIYTHKHDHNH